MPPGIGYGQGSLQAEEQRRLAARQAQQQQRPQSGLGQLQQGPNNLIAMLQQMAQQPQLPQQDRPGGLLGQLIQLLQRGNRPAFQDQRRGPAPSPQPGNPLAGVRTVGGARPFTNVFAQGQDTTRSR